MIVGANHTLSGTNSQIGNIVGGAGNTLNNGPDHNLVVGSGNQLQLNCHRNIVGGINNNVSGLNQDNIVSGNGNTISLISSSIIVGTTISIAGTTGTGCSAFGNNLVVSSNSNLAQMVIGLFNVTVPDARFIVGNGTGIGSERNALVVRNSGMMERTQGGLSVRKRVDAGATVTVAAETDYAVISTAAGSAIDLPAAPRDGQELKIKSVAGSTINATGGSTIDGAASLVLAAQAAATLIYDQATTTWYRF